MLREIIAHALEDDPIECCGIIAGNDGHAAKLYRAVNAAASKFRYEVETNDLIRIHREIDANGWDVLAIYHSHTGTKAYPSPTDIRLATWPEAHYVIISLANMTKPVVRAFHIVNGEVRAQRLRVTPDEEEIEVC